MVYHIIGVMILAGFYFFYMAKIVVQSKKSIKTNQMGIGYKPKKVLIIEKTLSIATSLTVIVEVISIFTVNPNISDFIRIAGAVIGFFAVIIFALAVITMKDSWRAGIPEKKTNIITDGIYSISRNPAFLGFNMLYLSILLMFFNILLLICSVWAAVMLHLQILQEENWFTETFGNEYKDYSTRVRRYLGRKK